MTHDEPFAFTYPDDHRRERREFRWKDDMTVENPETATAPETFEFLRNQFRIDPALSNREARKILNLRCMLYMRRMIFMDAYNPTPITLAYDVSPATVAAIEENGTLFTGVYVEVEAMREYPQGIYFSHMLGYIQTINEQELENVRDRGYTDRDLIGKSGIERSMERYLRGSAGSQTIEVDGRGRRIGMPLQVNEPQPGNRVFLTLDAELQRKAYHALEDELTHALVNKLTQRNDRETGITMKEIFTSFVKSNNLPIKAIMDAEPGGDAFAMRKYILDRFPDANATERASIERIKDLVIDGIEANRITAAMLMLTLIDTGTLTDPEGLYAARLRSHPRDRDVQPLLVEKMLAKEITPQMINLDPCTGSVVVVDVRTGSVLAAIGYPSFDNNRFVNVFDNEYYSQIYYYDPTNPGLNRPFTEPGAPGSTFKMITAAAALETGAITHNTRIFDGVTYTTVGRPYTRCANPAGHGSINVLTALSVSCNYFFCESAYRMGNVHDGTTLQGIQTRIFRA
jgi:penicillin-binding protein 2